MFNEKVKKIIAVITALFSMVCFAVTVTVTGKTGLISGLSPENSEKRDCIENQRVKDETVEGIFLDRNGHEITSASDPGKPAHVNYPESFSAIIGYNSARMVKKGSLTPGTSGLRETFYADLFNGGDDGIGATVQLTINAGLQEKLYNLLDGFVGSISIINASTGEIIVMASRGDAKLDYNVNLVDKVYSTADGKDIYYSDLYSQKNEFYFNRCTLAQHSPGSCAKPMTTVCLVENGKEDLIFVDTGYFLDNKIHNYAYSVYGECDLEKALNKSVNTYFAYAGIELGGSRLRETFERFMVGKNVELDFTTLKSNFLNNNEYSDFLIASNAYGQGQLVMSPLHIAMMMGTIINQGEMMKPYLINSITNDGKKTYEGEKELLSVATDKKSAEKVKKLLHSNAEYYGLYDHFSKKDAYIIAKTGTAEIGSSSKGNHIYYSMGVEIDGEIYGICIDKCFTNDPSSSLKPIAINVIDALISETDF